MMRLLLVEISPASQVDARLTTSLGYIAAYVRREISDIDVQIIKGDPDWIQRKLGEYRPDIVGLSTVSQYYPMAVTAAKLCQEQGIFVVIGGHHVSSLPQSMTKAFDLGVIGEGEHTMSDICRTYLDHGADQEAYREIPGVAFVNESGDVELSSPRPLHQPLDDIPFPARDLMHIRPGESIGLITSRGCPYHCVFCSSSAFWQSVRFHSAEYVVSEVNEVVSRYHTSHIYYWDDLFVAKPKRIERIADLLEQEPDLDKVRYSCTCRANLASDRLAQSLKRMNVVEVMIGFESMAPQVLQYLKPHVTVEDNRRAVEIFNRYNIKVTGFFVIGSPKETPEELEMTLDFVRNAPLYRAEAYLLTPLPGTPVWDDAVRKGLIDPDNVPWDRLYIDNPDNHENGIHMSETMSPEELRGYWREFQAIRTRKDRVNFLRRIPQHIDRLFRAPREELGIIVEQLRTRQRGHI